MLHATIRDCQNKLLSTVRNLYKHITISLTEVVDTKWYVHAVTSCQITVDEVEAGQVWHSFSHLLCKLQQLTSSKHLHVSTSTIYSHIHHHYLQIIWKRICISSNGFKRTPQFSCSFPCNNNDSRSSKYQQS